MENTEIVWRHLLACADDGIRRHGSMSALAADLGLPVSTTHKALAEPTRIGAVAVSRGAGVRVRDPFRLAVLWAGKRRLDRDITSTWMTSLSAPEVERIASGTKAVLGGFGAVVARVGANTIADYDTVLLYAVSDKSLRRKIPEDSAGSTTVIVAKPDRMLTRYGRVTPLHQAWVDLFNRPDWQAARFTEAITASWVADAA
jgi:hypothetical protein